MLLIGVSYLEFMAFSRSCVELFIAMMLIGVLGLIFCSLCGCHVSFGLLVASMIIFGMVVGMLPCRVIFRDDACMLILEG